MDKLTLSGLQYRARHGVYEQERREGNNFEVDLTFYADLDAAGRNDDLEATVDYQKAEKIVRNVMEAPPVNLIETLATRIGDELFLHFTPLQKLEVCVRKLHPPLETPTTYAQIIRTWTRS